MGPVRPEAFGAGIQWELKLVEEEMAQGFPGSIYFEDRRFFVEMDLVADRPRARKTGNEIAEGKRQINAVHRGSGGNACD